MIHCHEVQHWLLDAEDPRPDACGNTEIARHLEDCTACRTMAMQLAAIEDQWRSLPESPQSQRAKDAFLASLCEPAVPRKACKQVISRRRWLKWCTVSATGAAACGLAGWFSFGESDAQADDDLLDRLVGWNLELTQAPSDAERTQLYKKQIAKFQAILVRRRIAPENATLANEFLTNGKWLADHCDPLVAADRFDGLAERLLQLACEAHAHGNMRRMNMLLKQYTRLLESGVDINIERAEALGTLDFENQRQLERIALADTTRIRKIADLLESSPEASRPQICRALGVHHKQAQKAAQKNKQRRQADPGDEPRVKRAEPKKTKGPASQQAQRGGPTVSDGEK